jgi:hypothetical protein
MGNMPASIAALVITIGRTRAVAPLTAASPDETPDFCSCCANVAESRWPSSPDAMIADERLDIER